MRWKERRNQNRYKLYKNSKTNKTKQNKTYDEDVENRERQINSNQFWGNIVLSKISVYSCIFFSPCLLLCPDTRDRHSYLYINRIKYFRFSLDLCTCWCQRIFGVFERRFYFALLFILFFAWISTFQNSSNIYKYRRVLTVDNNSYKDFCFI